MWNENDKMMELVQTMEQACITIPAKCPICNEVQAHFLIHKADTTSKKGSAWIWCNACKSYSHFSYFVPNWWKNPAFLDVSKLDSCVKYPHLIETDIDEWVKALLRNQDGIQV